ncbi:MAG: NUDIX hydrolase [Solirubrobacterales bacterium]|jgi:8-oxo-dGTP pyrophosphatase MutT (NUDIX family)|nr:NUDIX hydrolase [Solirubrobacterales bacterium]
MPAEQEISYGGVVVRGEDVMVIVPRGRRRVLSLPKGGRDPGETPQQTAAREVREETGISATVRELLGQVDYGYRRGGRQVAKTVHYYLCEFESGDTADHDHEVDDARWMPLAEARRRLSYPGERAMIERALSILAANG